MLTRHQLIAKLQALVEKRASPAALAAWAVEQHSAYEANKLQLENSFEGPIFDVLVELIHNEDDRFRLSDDEIRKAIGKLEQKR